MPQVEFVPPILIKAVGAANSLKYSGQRTVEFLQGAQRRVHSEYVLQDGENARVWFPVDSPYSGQVIVETPRGRQHYYPKRNLIETLPPKREEALVGLRNWIQHPGKSLQISVLPGEPAAGRRTDLLTVADGQGRLRQRLWIDSQTGLVLRRELLDVTGMRVGFFEFSNVDYDPIIRPGDFEIRVRGARVVTLEDKVRQLATKNKMLPIMIPGGQGFVLDSANIERQAGMVVLHETYMGPRGKLSLFEVAGDVNLQGIQPPQKAFSFYGWVMSNHTFALVGNYALVRLRSLARQLGEGRNAP